MVQLKPKRTIMADKYISKKLSELYKSKSKVLVRKLTKFDKYILFSDLHRGVDPNSPADDFSPPNRITYFSALKYYLEEGYTLVLLGDIEELEEDQNIKKVMDANHDCIQNELNFHKQNRLIKIFGNHDDKWSKQENVFKELHPYMPGLKVYEGLLLEYGNQSQIFAVHGHQGTLISDRLGFLEFTLPVYKWYLNLTGKGRTTIYESNCLVGEHEGHLYDWAASQKDLLLICGHTHRPVWGATTHAEKLKQQLETIESKLDDVAIKAGVARRDTINYPAKYGVTKDVADHRKITEEHNKRIAKNGMCGVNAKPKPNFFNTGCCMFHDGDITGIEIDQGNMRLVKWDYNESQPCREVLEEETINTFLK